MNRARSDVASSNSLSEGSFLLEWVRERFPRSRSEPVLGEDKPRHRGMLISICVLIAVVLWFTLSIRETYTVAIDMPTMVSNLPDDTALATLPPEMVQVQLRGEGIELFRFHFNPPTLLIDAAKDEVDFTSLVSLPPGVVAENFSPRVFQLQKERRISRKIPIRSQADIETAETYDFFELPVLMPDSVIVSGAQSIVNGLKEWPTVHYQRSGLRDSLRVTIPLVDTLTGLVTLSRTATTLKAVAIEWTEGRRELRVEVTEVPTTQRIVQLEPPTVRVTYRVPLSQFEQARDARDFYATVPYTVMRADTTGYVRPRIHQPSELWLRNVEYFPSTLRYYERLIEE